MSLCRKLNRFGKTAAKRSLLRLSYLQASRNLRHVPQPQRALSWIRANELSTGGIRVHSWHRFAYPEVTGYLIPTLLEYGEHELAERFLEWLLCIQRVDGAYTSPDGVPYIFDSGQVLRGLLAGANVMPQAVDAARRTADYLCGQMIDGGSGGFGKRYDGTIPESVHLYVLPPLKQAAEVLGKPEYRTAAQRCLNYYRQHEDALRIDDLTHFLAYELEALIDLDQAEEAIPILNQLQQKQAIDGAVRGKGGVRWICTPGLAQLAICWFKTDQAHAGDKAVQWLSEHQRPSGGLLGSYGRGATYFPDVELSWAAKFYLDAYRLCESFTVKNGVNGKQSHAYAASRAKSTTAVTKNQQPARLTGSQWNSVLMSATDVNKTVNHVRCNQVSEWGRVILLETEHGSKVLEVGSGTGEISLQLAVAGRKVSVLDVSQDSLDFTSRCADQLGITVETIEADATQPLPFADNQFNCTWSSGLLEHFSPEERQSMLREWARVTSGKVINLVPNAASVAYRAGKVWQEDKGVWPYGLEVPLLSLREEYAAAGLHVAEEFSVGAKHALNFLPRFHPLRRALTQWMKPMSERDLQKCNQGYLLVSIGVKSRDEA